MNAIEKGETNGTFDEHFNYKLIKFLVVQRESHTLDVVSVNGFDSIMREKNNNNDTMKKKMKRRNKIQTTPSRTNGKQ